MKVLFSYVKSMPILLLFQIFGSIKSSQVLIKDQKAGLKVTFTADVRVL